MPQGAATFNRSSDFIEYVLGGAAMSNPYSILAHFYYDGVEAGLREHFLTLLNDTGSVGWGIGKSPSELFGTHTWAGGSNLILNYSPPNGAIGVGWHKFAVCFKDGSFYSAGVHGIKCWIDSSSNFVTNGASSIANWGTNLTRLRLGKMPSAINNITATSSTGIVWSGGKIAHVGIFSRLLSDAEVANFLDNNYSPLKIAYDYEQSNPGSGTSRCFPLITTESGDSSMLVSGATGDVINGSAGPTSFENDPFTMTYPSSSGATQIPPPLINHYANRNRRIGAARRVSVARRIGT